jgi:hypothetical protein
VGSRSSGLAAIGGRRAHAPGRSGGGKLTMTLQEGRGDPGKAHHGVDGCVATRLGRATMKGVSCAWSFDGEMTGAQRGRTGGGTSYNGEQPRWGGTFDRATERLWRGVVGGH